MARNSCIPHPIKEQLVIIRKWQTEFCEGNACAAALLSFYEYWHNIKLEIRLKNIKSNDIAQAHQEKRTQDESLFQFHTLDELKSGILGLYSKSTIAKANKFLEEKGVISISDNPNPRYKFDRTRYVLFKPEACIAWLKQQYSDNKEQLRNKNGEISNLENRNQKVDSRYSKFTISNPKITLRCSNSSSPSCKTETPITEITTETTTKKKAAVSQFSDSNNCKQTLPDISTAAAAFCDDAKISKILTHKQKTLVEQAAIELKSKLFIQKSITELFSEIESALLNPSCFKKTGHNFSYKLNAIKKAVRLGQCIQSYPTKKTYSINHAESSSNIDPKIKDKEDELKNLIMRSSSLESAMEKFPYDEQARKSFQNELEENKKMIKEVKQALKILRTSGSHLNGQEI